MCSRHIPSVFQYNREKGHRSGHPASWHPNRTCDAAQDEEVFGLMERRPGTGMDPMELWRQWFEASSRVWPGVLQGTGERYADPYGLYRQWFEGMLSMRQQVMGAVDGAGGSGDADPQEIWRKWFDATV